MIKKVKELEIGGKLSYAGDEYTIESFPTRYSVVLTTPNPSPGNPSHMKMPISKLYYSA